MKKFFAALAISTLVAAPFAAIAGEEDATIPANDVTGAEIYVDAETGKLYQESNGVDGLQTTAVDEDTPADEEFSL